MEVISKLPIASLGADLGELRKGLACIRNAIKSQTQNKNDQIELFLVPHEEKLSEIISSFEIKIKVFILNRINKTNIKEFRRVLP